MAIICMLQYVHDIHTHSIHVWCDKNQPACAGIETTLNSTLWIKDGSDRYIATTHKHTTGWYIRYPIYHAETKVRALDRSRAPASVSEGSKLFIPTTHD